MSEDDKDDRRELEAVNREVERLDRELKEQHKRLDDVKHDVTLNKSDIQQLAKEVRQAHDEARADHKDLVDRIDSLGQSLTENRVVRAEDFGRLTGAVKVITWAAALLVATISAAAAWFAIARDWVKSTWNGG